MKKIILLGFMLIFLVNIAYGIEFYNGNIIIESIDSKLEIGEELEVTATYIFKGNEKVNVDFYNFPDEVVVIYNGKIYGKNFDLDVNGEATVKLVYKETLSGGDFKVGFFNPNVYFNGKLSSKRVSKILTEINSQYKLISLSSNPNNVVDGAIKNYKWNYNDIYASTLSFSWNTQKVDIEVVREVPAEIDGVFTVKTILENKGSSVNDVVLETSFLPFHFSPVSPLNEFETITVVNDERIGWKKEIPYLGAGETLTFKYQLEPVEGSINSVLRPLNAYIDGSLVAISEKIEFLDTEVSVHLETSEELEVLEQLEEVSFVEDELVIPGEDALVDQQSDDVDAEEEPKEEVIREPYPDESLKGKKIRVINGKEYIVEKTGSNFLFYFILGIILVLLLIYLWYRKRQRIYEET